VEEYLLGGEFSGVAGCTEDDKIVRSRCRRHCVFKSLSLFRAFGG
jgi:hypothetical protein